MKVLAYSKWDAMPLLCGLVHFAFVLALDFYRRTSSDSINPFFRAVVPYLEPTRYDPIIRKFANAHELW